MNALDRSPVSNPDVCVIGSGPAGMAAAAHLAQRDHEIVILEAGKRFDLDEPGRNAEQLERAIRPEISPGAVWDMPEPRDVYAADVPEHVSFELNDRRVKAVGGTSLMWHGTVMRLPEKDFEVERRYGLSSDWPLDYEDLQAYYHNAEQQLGVAGAPGSLSPPREEPFPMPAFPVSDTDAWYIEACEALDIAVQSTPHARNRVQYDGRGACEGYGTCSPFCPSGAKYDARVHIEQAEAAGATIIDRAPVTRVEHDDAGEAVVAARYQTPDGTTHRQRADQFILACGPIETPRLLLLSASETFPDGLANRSDAVGRYFQATPYISTTAVADAPTQPTQTGFDTSMSYEFYEPDNTDLNGIWLTFRNEDPTPMVERALQGGAGHVRDSLFTEITGNPWGDELLERLRDADPASFANLRMSSYVEQLPDPDNRVTLDTSVQDPFGNPGPLISYDFDDRVEETMEYALEIHREIFEEMGVEITHEEEPLQRMGNDHKGTTRMGDDPTESVVDATGRTHDLDNLWIVGPSVFTHGGAVPPLLTAVALSLKTATHIDSMMR